MSEAKEGTKWLDFVLSCLGLCLIYALPALFGALLGVIIFDHVGLINILPAAFAVYLFNQVLSRNNY